MEVKTLLTTKASEELAKEVEKDLEKEDVAIAKVLEKCGNGCRCKNSGQA